MTDDLPLSARWLSAEQVGQMIGHDARQVRGVPHYIADIGMRMLTPRERFTAQGFGLDYRIDSGIGPDGEIVPLTQTAQGHMCGNSVSPPVAQALVRANVADQAEERAA